MKTSLNRAAVAFAVLLLSGAGVYAAVVTSKDGMTLYTFDKDKDGMSVCEGDCAAKWPPYLGKEGDEMKEGWTLVKRTDGTMQWAYDGKPVYLYIDDKKAGDMAGDNADGGVWHVVQED